MGSLGDVHTELDGEERQRLWTYWRYQHPVFRHVAPLTGTEKQWGQCKVRLKSVTQDISLTFSAFRGSLVARCTLLSARTRSTSSRLCWEIFRLSSSDTQPSQDRQALSSNWEPSCTLEGKKEECVRWRVSTETHLLINLLVDFHKESTSHKRQVFTKSVKIKATVVEISWLLVTGSFTPASFLNLPYLVNPHVLNCTPPVCKRLSVAHL